MVRIPSVVRKRVWYGSFAFVTVATIAGVIPVGSARARVTTPVRAASIESPFALATAACVGHPEVVVAATSDVPSLVAARGASGSGAVPSGLPAGVGGFEFGPVQLRGGETLNVDVGCVGQDPGATTGGAGGWGYGHGGPGGDAAGAGRAAGGGGGGTALLRGTNPILVVGGGGASGRDTLPSGVNGGSAGCDGLPGGGGSSGTVPGGGAGEGSGLPTTRNCPFGNGNGLGGVPNGQPRSGGNGGGGGSTTATVGGGGGGGGGGVLGGGGGGNGVPDPSAIGGGTGGGGGGGGSSLSLPGGSVVASNSPAGDGSLRLVTLENPNRGPYWPGWDIARGIATYQAASGGYVVDGFGGIHRFGSGTDPLPPVATNGPYWPGRDIARAIATLPDGTGGVILDGFGGLHPFGLGGNAPPTVNSTTYSPGRDSYRAVAILPDGTGGMIQDANGGWSNFFGLNGHAPPQILVYPTAPTTWTWAAAHGFVVQYGQDKGWIGGYVSDVYGGIHPFGTPAPNGGGKPAAPGPPSGVIGNPYWPGWSIARGIATYTLGPNLSATESQYPIDAHGGFELDGFGGLHPFVFTNTV